MGRHGGGPPDGAGRRPRRRRLPRGRSVGSVPVVLLAATLLGGAGVVAAVAGLPALLLGASDEGQQPATATPGCGEVVEVRVVTASELAPSLDLLDAAPLGPTADGVCARVRGIELGPVETLAGLTSERDSGRRADIWLPDSSLWIDRAGDAGVAVVEHGSLGTSPVVVASSAEVVDALGWADDPPSWSEVIGTDRALAVPDLQSSAALMAIDAARSGAGQEGATLTVQAVLARQRAGSLSPSEGFAQAASAGADAPLVITTEQDVLRRTGGSGVVRAVGPTGGTPVLDYPVLEVAPAAGPRSTEAQVAMDLVLAALTSGPGQALALEAGLRGPDLSPLPGSAPLVPVSEPYLRPDPDAADALVTDLARLAPPSQLLVVVDVSTSMAADVGSGRTRADVTAEALDGALAELTGPTRVGLWFFASALDGDVDHVEVLPVRRLDSTEGGTGHRQALDEAVAGIPDSLVTGGTSLYDTIDAAVTASREAWDPETVSTVVVITDGRNEDSTGLDLDGLTARLGEQADPERPVGLVAIAFGPDADLASLEQVAAAAGVGGPAQAVNAREPEALQSLLVQLLAARTATPTEAPSTAP